MFNFITIASPAYLTLAVVLVAAGRFAGGRFLPQILAVTGLALAASWLNPIQAVAFALVLGSNWLGVRWLWGCSESKLVSRIMLALILWNVALMMSTKIAGFSSAIGLAGLVGISYLTFRQIQLVLEAPSASVPFSSWLWLSFMVNPLTLIAGPIQNWNSHNVGLASVAPAKGRDALHALHRITTGIVKVLVLAPIFSGQSSLNNLTSSGSGWFDVLVVIYAYYIFLFFDFSGYIDIVVGVARLAGFRTLPENFNRPYLATNFQDFWGRWNTTLGLWFRIYIFTPLLAVVQRRTGSANVAIPSALFITFFLVGLWHGIAWNFVLFGLVQATGVTLTHFYKQFIQKRFGKAGLKVYDANRPLRVIRVALFQTIIAASFVLLDNDSAILLRHFSRLIP